MKKTKKLALILALVFLFSVAVLPVSASARAPITETVTQIANGIKARALYAVVDAANASIAAAVYIARITPYDDVDWLLATVDAIVAGVFAYADSVGAVVACEYTEYVIDGRVVYIDPIRVVNIPGTGG